MGRSKSVLAILAVAALAVGCEERRVIRDNSVGAQMGGLATNGWSVDSPETRAARAKQQELASKHPQSGAAMANLNSQFMGKVQWNTNLTPAGPDADSPFNRDYSKTAPPDGSMLGGYR